MTCSALAYGDTKPSWTYGGGDLWLYDWVDHFDPLRISATTGQVLQRLVVPKIWRPLLAFNNDGLWIAPTGDSTGPLYRLTPGATRLTPVFKLAPGGFAWWLVASGDSVWIDDQPRPVTNHATIWELRGPNAVPAWHQAASAALRAVVNQVGVDSPSMVVGSGSDDLWTVVVSPQRTSSRWFASTHAPGRRRWWPRCRHTHRGRATPRSFKRPGTQRRSRARCFSWILAR